MTCNVSSVCNPMVQVITLFELIKIANTYIENGLPLYNMTQQIKMYNGNDWKQYISFSDKTYKRNKIISTKYVDVYIICWKQNQVSKIHNHPDNGCIVKLLDGHLIEKSFTINCDKELYLSNIREVKKNDILYNAGSINVHQIEAIDDSVSLHIYPNYPKEYVLTYYNL
jgi:hypothetical protein